MLDSLTVDSFRPHVGEPVLVVPTRENGSVEAVRMEIAEARGLAGEGRQRKPFSIIFKGPGEPMIEQQICRVEHGRLGNLELFLVPLGPDDEGRARYEAVFT